MPPIALHLMPIFVGKMEQRKITDIFFDLDHTLWDFEANSKATFEQIFKTHSFPFSVEAFMEIYSPINHAYWKMYRENKIDEIQLRQLRLEKTFEGLSISVSDEVIAQIAEEYIQLLSLQPHLFKGAKTLLTTLQPKYKLHIITNGFENVQQRKLENTRLDHFFDVVLTAEKVGVKKPNPAIYQKALALAQAKPETSMMIGDSREADIEGALAVGMHALHFNSHQEALHDLCPIVNSLSEIFDYLD